MKNILAALELKGDTSRVVQHASDMAKALGARLWLLHVAAPDPDFVGYEPGPQYIRDERAEILKEERTKLHDLVAQLAQDGVDVRPIMVLGPTVETILQEAGRIGADLIVMGTHGRRGLAKAFLGSTSDDVLRANRFPVLIIPTHAQ